ncbi:MAG: putative lipid II flippase FtsW [Bacteriovoracaceae bacterium]
MIEREIDSLDKLTKALMITIAVLVTIGLIMVLSSSYIFAKDNFGNSYYFFLKQLVYLSVSLIGAAIVAKTKFSFWLKYAPFFAAAVGFLIVLTFVPQFGSTAKGASRWLTLWGSRLQPGEFFKVTCLLCGIDLFENYGKYSPKQLASRVLVLLIPLLFIVKQPDFGTFIICFLTLSLICYLSSFPRKWFYPALGIGIVSVLILLFAQPYRVKRLMTFMDPWKNPQTSGFQIIQSYLAFAHGSITGAGLGNSNEKLFYLPEAHNDFIFSVVGEELGFLGVISTVFLFMFFIVIGLKIGARAKSKLTYLTIVSIVSLIGVQALLNMSVVLGIIPTKGLNLPLISSGGSSLLTNFWAIGILFSCIKYENKRLHELNQFQSTNNNPFFLQS